jgi:glycerophosphoryl diester phosphodiesterase
VKLRSTDRRLLAVAHRGGSALRPENTMAAFQHSIELGVDLIETDVRLTADERLVLIHSADHVEESTNGSGAVGHLRLAEIKDLDAGSHFSPDYAGEPVATLEELLLASRGRVGLLLDTDGDRNYYRHIIDALRAAEMLDQVVIGVRSVEAVNDVRALAPEASLLSFGFPQERATAISECGTDVLRLWGCWPELIAEAHAIPKPVWVMAGAPNERDGGKTDVAQLRWWAAVGVAGVILDDPRLIASL